MILAEAWAEVSYWAGLRHHKFSLVSQRHKLPILTFVGLWSVLILVRASQWLWVSSCSQLTFGVVWIWSSDVRSWFECGTFVLSPTKMWALLGRLKIIAQSSAWPRAVPCRRRIWLLLHNLTSLIVNVVLSDHWEDAWNLICKVTKSSRALTYHIVRLTTEKLVLSWIFGTDWLKQLLWLWNRLSIHLYTHWVPLLFIYLIREVVIVRIWIELWLGLIWNRMVRQITVVQ